MMVEITREEMFVQFLHKLQVNILFLSGSRSFFFFFFWFFFFKKCSGESKVLQYFKLPGWIKCFSFSLFFFFFLLLLLLPRFSLIFGNLYLHVISLIWDNLSNHCWIVYSVFHLIYKHCLFIILHLWWWVVKKKLPFMLFVEKKTECKGCPCTQCFWHHSFLLSLRQKKWMMSKAQNWFRHFKEGDTILQNKPRSKRSSVVEDEILLEMVEQQPSTTTCTLSTELGPSQITTNHHLH